MPVPRADFVCDEVVGVEADEYGPAVAGSGCGEGFTLPVAYAGGCPNCGTPLRRLWTPPNINNGMAKRTDRIVEPAYEEANAARNKAKDYKKEFTSKPEDSKAALGAVPSIGRVASQTISVPLIQSIPGGPIGQSFHR